MFVPLARVVLLAATEACLTFRAEAA